jgi:hypothetical protein
MLPGDADRVAKTMQRIMRGTDKVIVDTKTGVIPYLPLGPLGKRKEEGNQQEVVLGDSGLSGGWGPGCSSRSERRAHKGRKGLRASLPHDGRSMIVDRALADAEIGGDVLARVTGEHELQDLALTRGETANA